MSDKPDSPRCSKRVWSGSWDKLPCSRRGVIERDGKWYCKQHDPVAVKERNDKNYAAMKSEWEERDKRANRTLACERACAGIADPEKAIREAREALALAIAEIVSLANECQIEFGGKTSPNVEDASEHGAVIRAALAGLKGEKP
jgi:predicted NBD/HSP70 family sugar kinase